MSLLKLWMLFLQVCYSRELFFDSLLTENHQHNGLSTSLIVAGTSVVGIRVGFIRNANRICLAG